MTRSLSFVLLLLAVCVAVLAPIEGAYADKRVALVIGNSNYKNTPALTNPVNDATDLAHALTALGFQVTLKLDAEKRQMDQAVAQFSREATDADAALFYYAGHGMQFQGQNYVMPVDAELQDEISLRYEMTAIDDVKAALQRSSGVKIMVLDSCRNNPLAAKLVRSIKVTTRDIPNVQGYARPEKTRGMIIVYATQADDVANDGVGRNSPFSSAFLKELKEPGLEIGTMFRRIGDDVYQATNGSQSPELSISLVPEYFLNQSETDQTIWARIRASSNANAIREFLSRYPDSFYAPDAKARLDLLDGGLNEKAAGTMQTSSADATASESARLKLELVERERAAREAQLHEQALAGQLEAAETERQRLASQLAQREAAQQAPAVRAEKNQLPGEAPDSVQPSAKSTQPSQADSDRAQDLKSKIAQLELQVAQAKADVVAQTQKAADVKKTVDSPRVAPAPAEPLTKVASLLPEQAALVGPIQAELKRLGCYGGGDWASAEMQRAVAKYVRYAKLDGAPDAPSRSLLEGLKSQHDRVCPSECTAREVELGGRCVARTCGRGEILTKTGSCAPRLAAPRVAASREAAPKTAPVASKGHCFSFNGNQYCE
jgi:Caspase domain